jgi:hypothetical protein
MGKYDEDEHITYSQLNDKLKSISKTEKNRFHKILIDEGESLLDDIDKRKEESELKKIPYINYIISKTNEMYDENELYTYELYEIIKIYHNVKKNNKSVFAKIIEFIFGK